MRHSIGWFKYDRDCLHLFTHKSVPVIFEPPCSYRAGMICTSLKPFHFNAVQVVYVFEVE